MLLEIFNSHKSTRKLRKFARVLYLVKVRFSQKHRRMFFFLKNYIYLKAASWMLLMKPSQIGAVWGWGPLGRGGRRAPGVHACGWYLPEHLKLLMKTCHTLLQETTLGTTNEKRGGGGWKCRVNISVIRFFGWILQELASTRNFKKKSESKNWPVPGISKKKSESKNWWLSWKNWWFSLSFFPVLWLLDLFSRAPSRGEYRKNIQFWGWGFSENGNHQLHIYIISLIIYKELMRPPRTNCPNTGKSHVDRLKLFEG